MANVREAQSNGFDLVCAKCGVGMGDEDFEEPGAHDTGCPNEGRDREAEMVAFLKERLS